MYSASQGGNIVISDLRTGEERSIHPYPKRVGSAGDAIADHKYRFNWNAPIALGIRSLAPALAAGCTAAVILPKETAQLNALISEVISETDDLPPGVVNIVTSGRDGLEYLVESPECR